MQNFLKQLEIEELTTEQIRMMNPLKLAYLGDAIYEVYIRRYLITNYNLSTSDMNLLARSFVRASSQSVVILTLKEELSTEEWAIVRRARNQKNIKVPKNASLSEYRYATGLEALFGYLHLLNEKERLEELIIKGIDIIQKEVIDKTDA